MYTYKVTIFYNVDGYEGLFDISTHIQANSVDEAEEEVTKFLESRGLPVGPMQIKRCGESS